MRRPSNSAVAIGLSLALHALLLAWLFMADVVRIPHPPPSPQRLVVDLYVREPERKAPPGLEKGARDDAKPKSAPRREDRTGQLAQRRGNDARNAQRLPDAQQEFDPATNAQRAQASADAQPAKPSTDGVPPTRKGALTAEVANRAPMKGPGEPVADTGESTASAPRALNLTPRALADSRGDASIDPGGRTIRNDGSDATAGLLLEEEARVGGRVQAWATEDMASLRVDGGSKSTYFVELKNAFEEAVRRSGLPKPDRSAFEDARKIAEGSAREGGAMVRRYAQTGNPNAARSAEERDVDHRVDQNAYVLAARPMVTGEPEHRAASAQVAQAIGQASALNRLVAQIGASSLKAIVQVEQRRSDGKLNSAEVVQSSGNELFDELVIQAAFDAVENLPPPPPGATGTHADLVRTVWEFAGRLQYRKKLRDIAPADRALAIAAGILSAPLAGLPFEETTGDVYLPDFANPQLDCSAKLLKLY